MPVEIRRKQLFWLKFWGTIEKKLATISKEFECRFSIEHSLPTITVDKPCGRTNHSIPYNRDEASSKMI